MSEQLDPVTLAHELAAIEAESMGWLPLEAGAYLHLAHSDEEEVIIAVTGVPDIGMLDMNVLLLC